MSEGSTSSDLALLSVLIGGFNFSLLIYVVGVPTRVVAIGTSAVQALMPQTAARSASTTGWRWRRSPSEVAGLPSEPAP